MQDGAQARAKGLVVSGQLASTGSDRVRVRGTAQLTIRGCCGGCSVSLSELLLDEDCCCLEKEKERYAFINFPAHQTTQ